MGEVAVDGELQDGLVEKEEVGEGGERDGSEIDVLARRERTNTVARIMILVFRAIADQ